MEEHIVKTRDNYLLGIHRIPTGKYYDDDDNSAKSHMKSVFNNCGISLSNIRTKDSRSLHSTKERKPVVLLYHGLMMCSEIWMCNMEEERQLPFLLANAGYVTFFF
jgi:lysosomal acid lipase/cholesteryl ester hydrolase